jgi:hypothetical protein
MLYIIFMKKPSSDRKSQHATCSLNIQAQIYKLNGNKHTSSLHLNPLTQWTGILDSGDVTAYQQNLTQFGPNHVFLINGQGLRIVSIDYYNVFQTL